MRIGKASLLCLFHFFCGKRQAVRPKRVYMQFKGNAFADCPSLRRIHIPDSVGYVDETALDGCENVIVCGGIYAESLAHRNGFTFVGETGD